MEDIVTKGRFHRTEVLVERFQFPFHARHLFGCHTLYPLRSPGLARSSCLVAARMAFA